MKHEAEVSETDLDPDISGRSAGVPPAVAGSPPAHTPRWAELVAPFFCIGRLRPGPGTWASAATVVLWWLITRWIGAYWQPWAAILLAPLGIAVGIPPATRLSRASGSKDPQWVVIDEVAGQLIALIAVPISWKSLLL